MWKKSLFLKINPATWETQTQIIVDVMQSHSQRTSKNDKKGLSLEKLLQIAFHPPRHFKFENILIIIMSHISTSTISKIIITVLFWLYAKIQPSLSPREVEKISYFSSGCSQFAILFRA